MISRILNPERKIGYGIRIDRKHIYRKMYSKYILDIAEIKSVNVSIFKPCTRNIL